jgi:hypothetical protein
MSSFCDWEKKIESAKLSKSKMIEEMLSKRPPFMTSQQNSLFDQKIYSLMFSQVSKSVLDKVKTEYFI